MKIDWKSPSIVWLEHAGENAAVAASGVALSLMTPGGETHAPWQTILMLSAKAGLYAILLAIVSRTQSNGTASFNPHIVARKRVRRKTTNVVHAPQAPTTADLKPPST